MAWILRGRKENSEAKLDLSTRDLLHGGAVARSAAQAEFQRMSFLPGCFAPANRQLPDLNFPPTSVFADDSVDLRLDLMPSHTTVSSAVCTLEKVKLALERGSRTSAELSPSSASSITTPSAKRRVIIEKEGPESPSAAAGKGMMLAGCRQCLVHVLVCKCEPRCPQCNSNVRVPATSKKPRIDLNSSRID